MCNFFEYWGAVIYEYYGAAETGKWEKQFGIWHNKCIFIC